MVILVPLLYVLSGVCAYAALHHALIAWRRPVDRTNLVFAMFCFAAGLYIGASAVAYHADSAQALVTARRWQFSLGVLTLVAFPWFVAEYTAARARLLPAAFSVFFVLVVAANFALPFGISFNEFPEMKRFVLPWGEQVADLRVRTRSGWHTATWLGVLSLFAYSIHACVRQYRAGARRRALTLGLAIGLFIALSSFNQIVNFGLVQFVHTGELSFLSLVAVMSLGMTRELREREQRMQAVLDNVPAAVFMKTLDGRYLMVNRRFEQWSNLAGGSVIGKSASDLLPAGEAEVIRAHDRQVIESRRSLEFEEAVVTAGVPRTYVSLKFPLLDQDGIPYAVCGVSTDVTDARQSEREMSSLRRQVWHADRVARTGALSASIAHELNQPLAAILANAQAALRFLHSDNPDLAELREILSDIVHDNKRAGTVITSLRSMLKQKETERSSVNVAETLNEMLALLRSELIERRVEVKTGFAADCIVRADKSQIQQVLLNLVMNALEAMSEQPQGPRRLELSAAPAGDDEVRIAVRDSGTGIPRDRLDKVFDPFYSTKPFGMGIGLAVSRAIVEAHGGSIWVEPAPDHGVTFCFTLPLEKPASAAAVGAPVFAVSGGR